MIQAKYCELARTASNAHTKQTAKENPTANFLRQLAKVIYCINKKLKYGLKHLPFSSCFAFLFRPGTVCLSASFRCALRRSVRPRASSIVIVCFHIGLGVGQSFGVAAEMERNFGEHLDADLWFQSNIAGKRYSRQTLCARTHTRIHINCGYISSRFLGDWQ